MKQEWILHLALASLWAVACSSDPTLQPTLLTGSVVKDGGGTLADAGTNPSDLDGNPGELGEATGDAGQGDGSVPPADAGDSGQLSDDSAGLDVPPVADVVPTDGGPDDVLPEIAQDIDAGSADSIDTGGEPDTGPTGPVCGDGICQFPIENPGSCAVDCPPVCGDGLCQAPKESVATCAADCPPVCGDGVCQAPTEGPANCSADCGPVCGDGVCQAPTESPYTCALDCGQPPADLSSCLASKCAASWNACAGNAACKGAAVCAGKCADVPCLVSCAKSADWATVQGLLQPLSICAVQTKCLAAATKSSGSPAGCGDGACNNNETYLTCSLDCLWPVSANEWCQTQACTASYQACLGDAQCIGAAACYNQGKPVQFCTSSSQAANELAALVQCIQTMSCPGQGGGGDGGTPAGSCQGKCGQWSDKWSCNCDSKCASYSDCCADKVALCGQ